MRSLTRLIAPGAIVTLFYFGVLVYPVLRCLWLIMPDWRPGTGTLLVIMLGPLLGRLACEWRSNAFTRGLSALSMTWLGCCFVLFSVTITWEITNVFANWPAATSGIALLGAAAAVSLAGIHNARALGVRVRGIESDRIPAALRVAQISDVHLGSRGDGFLRRVVERVNEQAPDLVLITGDLIDFAHMRRSLIAPLANLDAPALFCTGNHERYVDLEAIVTRLQDLGIEVLRNRTVVANGVAISGVDDADDRYQVRNKLRHMTAEPGLFHVLLYHRPDGAEDAAAWGADLMLTGQTHNGQIIPFNYLVKRIFPRICGEYRVGGLQLFVSPGTGTWGPVMRLGSRNEITMFELRPTVAPGAGAG